MILRIDPDKMNRIAQLIEDQGNKVRWQRTADQLNEERCLTTHGKIWTGQSLRLQYERYLKAVEVEDNKGYREKEDKRATGRDRLNFVREHFAGKISVFDDHIEKIAERVFTRMCKHGRK